VTEVPRGAPPSRVRHAVSPDQALAAALVLVVFAYAALWPRDLYFFDEGLFLYEATRILHGEVFYRDFFEISAPLSFYVMAACFKVFGVSFLAARALMAVLHGLIALLIFGSARTLGVRRSLAFVAGLVYPALAYMALPFASPHWFGTALSLLLVRLALSRRGRECSGWLGVVVGLLIVTQHQKGAVLGAGVGAVMLLDAALARWYGAPARPLAPALARYAGGIAAVVVPVLAALLASAGPGPLYAALVRFPFESYRGYHRDQTWGRFLALGHGDVSARLPAWLPLFIALSFASGARGAWRRADREAARARLVLGLLGAAMVLSVLYNPDAVHLTLIAPVGLIAAVERLEAGLGWVERRRTAAPIGALVAGMLASAVIALLGINLHVRRTWYAVRADTVLGPIDFADHTEPSLLAVLRPRLRDEPVREVFGYPFYASLYLLAEAQNPTRFQVLKPGYSTPAQIAEALQTLEARRTPYVVVLPYSIEWSNDDVIHYLDSHYERIPIPGVGPRGPFVLFHRRPAPSP
jgi:hypothetical protein